MKVAGQSFSSSRLFWPATGPYWQLCILSYNTMISFETEEPKLIDRAIVQDAVKEMFADAC